MDVTVQVERNVNGQNKVGDRQKNRVDTMFPQVDGQVEFREYLSMTISVDHDVIDGAPAIRFALRLKELIESGYGLFDLDSATRRNNIILQA